MKKVLLVAVLVFATIVNAQVKPGERLVFVGSYNMSGLMTQIAQVTMQTNTVSTSKKTFLHLSWEASTYSKWDNFFKIRDYFETYVDPSTFKPALFKRNTLEGKYTKTEKYIFNGASVTGTSKTKNRAVVPVNFRVSGGAQDIISMIYKLRTQDLAGMKPGQIRAFSVVFDQKEYPVWVKMIAVETITAGSLGKRPCYKMSIASKTDKLKGADKNLIWFTADAQKVPVMVRFSIPVGTGQIVLTSASGI